MLSPPSSEYFQDSIAEITNDYCIYIFADLILKAKSSII